MRRASTKRIDMKIGTALSVLLKIKAAQRQRELLAQMHKQKRRK